MFFVVALMSVHEYKALQSEEERRRYIEQAHGESFASSFKKTELFSRTYTEVSDQVEELLVYENTRSEVEDEDLSYPTSIFTQVYLILVFFLLLLLPFSSD